MDYYRRNIKSISLHAKIRWCERFREDLVDIAHRVGKKETISPEDYAKFKTIREEILDIVNNKAFPSSYSIEDGSDGLAYEHGGMIYIVEKDKYYKSSLCVITVLKDLNKYPHGTKADFNDDARNRRDRYAKKKKRKEKKQW